jgi:ABC-type Na+ efflux pump permease subunit
MAKFKLAKGKPKAAPRPQGGLPCVVFLILAMFLVMFILYYAMTHANR